MTGEQEDMETYQVIMDGHGPFSAPYTNEQNAENRAEELESEIPSENFHVESWPNHRQEDVGVDQT